MKAFYSDHFVLPLPEGHRFPMAKYGQLKGLIRSELSAINLLEAPRASDGELALVHHPAYISAVVSGAISAAGMREIGFPWSSAMVERSRRSTGATIAAARIAFQEGICGNLAGGTHHAYAGQGGGFCVFNDAAVAARLMQAEWARKNPVSKPLGVLIIDLDVHQGNGTASIFQNDPTVFTLSLHGAKNYPFRKETSDLDVPLADGCSDADYLASLDDALSIACTRFDPGLAIYLAGADPHEGDRLGRLGLSYDGLIARDQRVFDWCLHKKIPVAFVMAGGYGHNIKTTLEVQMNTYRTALDYWHKWKSSFEIEMQTDSRTQNNRHNKSLADDYK